MLEKPRGYDLSLEKQKQKCRHTQPDILSSVRLSNAEMDNHIGEKNPAEERTIATELSVPNMHIKDTQGF